MKKLLLILTGLFLFSGLSMAMPIYDQEAWIGAYQFKNMSVTDKFYPYIDIRHDNFPYVNDGSTIRTIMSDYILIQELPVTKKITASTQNWNNVVNVDVLVAGIDKPTFEQFIIQYKTLLLLKNEIRDKDQLLKSFLGSAYEKFLYRFFHFQIVKFETSIIGDDNNYDYADDDPQEIKDLKMELRGVFLDKEIQMTGEIKDSIQNMNYINSMIPAYPEKLYLKINQPFVSTDIVKMDPYEKTTIMAKLGNQIKFGYAQKVTLLTTLVNKDYLNGIDIYLQSFTNAHLDQLQNKYKILYGNNFDISYITPVNLTSVLKTSIKL